MTSPEANTLFDAAYYATGLGLPYKRDERWLAFFAGVANKIVAEIGPGSVLDAGCALGMLVEQLRARQVDAEGVDISEFAIGSAHPSVQPYVRVGSVAAPFGRRYDLIVSIEVLEHMPRAEAERAVANFCAHSDDVLFSSSPLDFKEPTHFNVNPPEYWAALFAQHGLFRDVDFDASFVTPWATRFRRRSEPPHRLVRDYERRFWELWRERGDLRQLALEQREQLVDAEARAASASLQAEAAARTLRSRDEQAARLLREAAAAPQAEASELRAYAARLEAELATKNTHIARLEALVRGLERGRVMRALRWLARRQGDKETRRQGDKETRRQGESPLEPSGAPGLLVSPASVASDAPGRGASAASDAPYARWIAATEPGPAELERQREQAQALAYQPLISAIMPVFNPPPAALEAAIASLHAQTYGRWELCVADGGSAPEQRAILEQAAAADPRVRVTLLGANGGIAANSNAALAMAQGEFLLILDHDDALAPNALFSLASLLQRNPDADAICFDEDKLSEDGATRHSPWFKPQAPSPDLLLSTNYLMHGLFRRSLVAELSGFDPATDGAQDWDLALRVSERTTRIYHIPQVLYHWRQVPGSAAREATAKPWAIAAQRRALEGHLRRTGAVGAKVQVSEQGLAHVLWPTFGLKVSIIIPTKDKAALLRACVGSILRATAYPSFEIVLVDTGSSEPATAALYAELAADPRVKVVELPGPFNWGRANNVGARHATGDRLLFLNNDTEVLDSGWLDELVGWVERREVGVVGARLVRPDGTTQHAGIAIGVEGHGSHLFDGSSGPVYGPFGSSEWYRDLLAVTGACMLVRRELFDALGGFDEAYSVGYSDIAFCLDAVARGLHVVYTPFARLLHHEGASRGLSLPPADVLRATMRMLPLIAAGDPFFSPNLAPTARVPAVADPTGEDALDRLATILRQFGLVYYDGSAPLREIIDGGRWTVDGEADGGRWTVDGEADGGRRTVDGGHQQLAASPAASARDTAAPAPSIVHRPPSSPGTPAPSPVHRPPSSPGIPAPSTVHRPPSSPGTPAPSTVHRRPSLLPSLLLITHDLGMSGAPIILAELAVALAARGYALTVAAPADGPLRDRLEAAGVRVRVVPHLIGDATAAYSAIAGHDLALVNTIHGARAVHAARAAGVPCVWWVHEAGFGRRLADERPEVAQAFAAADALVFPTAATAARYVGLLPGPAPSPVPFGVRRPDGTSLRTTRIPLRVDGVRRSGQRAAPALGADTTAVLKALT